MNEKIAPKLDPRRSYLQVALNSTLEDARLIINQLPLSDRIIVEVGTPLIKRYGEAGIRQIRDWYALHLSGITTTTGSSAVPTSFFEVLSIIMSSAKTKSKAASATTNGAKKKDILSPYIVADLKTMDRGQTEVEMAARGGANAAVALGTAPVETLNEFIAACEANGLDAMIDMMNVDYPLGVLRTLKKIPPVVIIHRGVDEEKFNHEKQIPLHEIRRIKGNYNIMISIAGGDTLREVQSSVFNDADIVVVWKSVFQKTEETIDLINGFLKAIK
ncbi:MAG: hypothetical protein C3F02_01600 [Parcubacteria group bacterium]|nr:MAG: hypothetical protein C3F02_01600 [Parcubacteria group bacterium]